MSHLNERIKKELCKISYSNGCCKTAVLSAFIRTAGSIEVKKNTYGFSVSSSSGECLDYFADLTQELYGCRPIFTMGKNSIIGFSVVDENSLRILIDLALLKLKIVNLLLLLNQMRIW